MNLSAISKPDYKEKIIFKNGYNNNIITTLNSKFTSAVDQTKNVKFSGDSFLTKGRAIWNYIKNNIDYKKDSPDKQIIQLPSRMILDTKNGDCKSMSLAAAAFMYNNGFSNVRLRYVSYNGADTTPTHVYAVGSDNSGNDIIIDAVYKQFNAELPYKYKKDYKMEISVLSGVPSTSTQVVKMNVSDGRIMYIQRIKKILPQLKSGGVLHNVFTNELARLSGKIDFPRYGDPQLNKYKKLLESHLGNKSRFVQMMVRKEINSINNGSFIGNIISNYSAPIQGIQDDIGKISLKKIGRKIKSLTPKKIFQGVKTIGLIAPRKAFLALVALNVRGLAIRLSKLSDDKLKKLWVTKFAGKFDVLKKAIKNGVKRKPLFGASKKIKSINGVDDVMVVESINGIGDFASVAAFIATAAPILLEFTNMFKKDGIPEVPENGAAGSESGDFPESEGMTQDAKPKLVEYFEKAVDIAKSTGIIPDRPLTNVEQQVDAAIPNDDYQSESKFKINPLIIVGGGLLAFMLLKEE